MYLELKVNLSCDHRVPVFLSLDAFLLRFAPPRVSSLSKDVKSRYSG